MFVSPMLLHKFTPPFSEIPWEEDNYITELKLDGFRLILSKFDGLITLYTRHKNDVSGKFPELLSLDIPDGTVLDGEVVVTDSFGRPDFEQTMSRFHAGKNGKQRVQYCIFDIIYYNGQKVASKPLIERKEILESLIVPNDNIALVQWTYGHGEEYFNLIKENGLEGIVMKRANSSYQIKKRSHDWLKVINYQYAEAFVTGYRKGEFGLLLGIEDKGKIRSAGMMEFMTPAARKQFYQMKNDFIIDENNEFVFLDPKIRLKVKFRNFTSDGKLRIPSFVEYVS